MACTIKRNTESASLKAIPNRVAGYSNPQRSPAARRLKLCGSLWVNDCEKNRLFVLDNRQENRESPSKAHYLCLLYEKQPTFFLKSPSRQVWIDLHVHNIGMSIFNLRTLREVSTSEVGRKTEKAFFLLFSPLHIVSDYILVISGFLA